MTSIPLPTPKPESTVVVVAISFSLCQGSNCSYSDTPPIYVYYYTNYLYETYGSPYLSPLNPDIDHPHTKIPKQQQKQPRQQP